MYNRRHLKCCDGRCSQRIIYEGAIRESRISVVEIISGGTCFRVCTHRPIFSKNTASYLRCIYDSIFKTFLDLQPFPLRIHRDDGLFAVVWQNCIIIRIIINDTFELHRIARHIHPSCMISSYQKERIVVANQIPQNAGIARSRGSLAVSHANQSDLVVGNKPIPLIFHIPNAKAIT